jgi:hypothetical protein
MGVVVDETKIPLAKEKRIDAHWDHKINKFLFLICLNQENRIRVLEGKAEITQQTYFDALKDRARNLDSLLEV